ncbi:putative FAD-linked oxidoreductase [Stieleria maiorica]|uniref:Putative FAD-linked oxidoreductase n=1 Tax=Stieleria maiorica TaxID=2795974 RepID=A0A5B9MA14_9BACT|nr:FAD-binding protein [Stieleria maiorica]QEF98131.1 putative FAD-linked oxidoreductase [Stieleria maiorica]
MSELQSNRAGAQPSGLVEVDSVAALQELVRSSDSIVVVGNRSKPALSAAAESTQRVTTRSLTGIIEYEPSEFTFTALAGTTLREINATLAEKDQYLPFDPMLVESDATIAGTLAAGLSGPGRHRYGGIRDFVLGAQFIAGDGNLIHSGGKVVKNAAGFDIPKLLVGSCGRLGAITALTFKVFPRPSDFHSYQLQCDDHQDAATAIGDAARGRWELDAIDYHCQSRSIWVRMGGPKTVCDAIIADMARSIGNRDLIPMSGEQSAQAWAPLMNLRFGGPDRPAIVKVPMDLQQMQRLATWCDERRDRVCLHTSVAGSIGWLAAAGGMLDDVDAFLAESSLTGLVIRDDQGPLGRWTIGAKRAAAIDGRIKHAMDPPGRFPGLEG